MYKHKESSPCYGCKERIPGCHGDCEKYKEFSEKIAAEKALKPHDPVGAMISEKRWNHR